MAEQPNQAPANPPDQSRPALDYGTLRPRAAELSEEQLATPAGYVPLPTVQPSGQPRRRPYLLLFLLALLLAIAALGYFMLKPESSNKPVAQATVTPEATMQAANLTRTPLLAIAPSRSAQAAPGTVTPLAATGTRTLAAAPAQATLSPNLTATTATPQPGPIYYKVNLGLANKLMTLETSRGAIVIELFANAAPGTVASLQARANIGEFDGRTFHRIENWLVQGNDPLCNGGKVAGCGDGGGAMSNELNDVPFKVGSVGMARSSDIRYSNASQFFIVKAVPAGLDLSFLNTKVGDDGVPVGGYTNIGQVAEGMDVVNRLQAGDKIIRIRVADRAILPTLPPMTPAPAPALPSPQPTITLPRPPATVPPGAGGSGN